VQLLLAPFASPLTFDLRRLDRAGRDHHRPALRSAMTAEGRQPRWVARSPRSAPATCSPGCSWLGPGVRHRPAAGPSGGASSPYGSLALIAMFSGFFVMMGLLWAVIRD
jgi:hypothetical protein